MAYPSIEQLANLALIKIGQQTIPDINGTGHIEEILRLQIPQARRHLLECHAWNFATARAELVESTTENIFGYSKRFALPTDYLKLLQVYEDSELYTRIDEFKIEGRALLTDFGSAWLVYTSDVQNPEDWTPVFVECMVNELGSRIAEPMGAGAEKRIELIQELQLLKEKAMLSNAQEANSNENHTLLDRIQRSPLIKQHNNIY